GCIGSSSLIHKVCYTSRRDHTAVVRSSVGSGAPLSNGGRLCSEPMVEFAAGRQDLRRVVFRPISDRADQSPGIDPGCGQPVLHAWRNGRIDGAVDESVSFQGPQSLGQHLRRDAVEETAQLVETHRPIESPQGAYDI